MTADKLLPLVPKLRFPEFIAQPLHDICLGDVTEESTIRNGDNLPESSVMGVRKGEGIVPMEERLIAPNISRYKIVRTNWFAYNPMRLNIGSIARHHQKDDVLVSPDYVVFRCLEEGNAPKLSPEFLDHFRGSDQWDAFVTEAGDGGVRVRIYYNNLAKLRLAVPDIAEQQKIADCLGSLDDLIAAEGRKLEALRQHKQGLMQQLFPQPGETVPRLRFPEFENAGDWEEKRIGDLEPFVTSGSRGWAAFYAPQGSLFVRITNLARDSINLDLADPKYVELPVDTEEGSRTVLKVDDVLVSITADIGIIGYVDADTPSPAYINQHIALVRFDAPKVRGKFMAYFLASEAAQRQFRSATDNGAKAGMNLMGVRAINLLLPSPSEQQRISDCLTSLDTCVVKQTQKLDALKTHKQGLLQQLFPSSEGNEK